MLTGAECTASNDIDAELNRLFAEMDVVESAGPGPHADPVGSKDAQGVSIDPDFDGWFLSEDC